VEARHVSGLTHVWPARGGAFARQHHTPTSNMNGKDNRRLLCLGYQPTHACKGKGKRRNDARADVRTRCTDPVGSKGPVGDSKAARARTPFERQRHALLIDTALGEEVDPAALIQYLKCKINSLVQDGREGKGSGVRENRRLANQTGSFSAPATILIDRPRQFISIPSFAPSIFCAQPCLYCPLTGW
jgi:hypothetical protein